MKAQRLTKNMTDRQKAWLCILIIAALIALTAIVIATEDVAAQSGETRYQRRSQPTSAQAGDGESSPHIGRQARRDSVEREQSDQPDRPARYNGGSTSDAAQQPAIVPWNPDWDANNQRTGKTASRSGR